MHALSKLPIVPLSISFVTLDVTHNEWYIYLIMARAAIHPGRHLAKELKTLNMSAAELARQIRVPTNRVTGIINGKRAITGDTALRLGHFFGTGAEFWLNLQKLYELSLAEARTGKMIRALPTLADRLGAGGRS